MLGDVDAAQRAAFVERHTAELTLPDGAPIVLRPIVPEDKADLLDGFRRLSPDSRYRRFLTSTGKLEDRVLRYLTEIDYHDHFAWAAFDPTTPGRPGVGVSRYVRLRDEPAVAEAAVTVVDDWHRRGLGRLLLESLVPVALDNDITTFRGYLLVENHPMVELLRSIGARLSVDEPGVLRMDLDLPGVDKDLSGTPLYEALRSVAREDLPVRHTTRPAQGATGPRTG